MTKKQLIFFGIFCLLVLINLVILNYFVYSLLNETNKLKLNITENKNLSGTYINQVPKSELGNYFDTSTIKEATSSLTQKLVDLEEKINIKNLPKSSGTISTMNVKEYYIPLGSSSTSASNWIDLPGVEANLAPSNYGKITGIYFEAGLRIPSGNGRIYARLKNITDNIGLFESEIFRDGNSAGMISSGKIPIPVSTKLYRVQLKSTLGVEGLLENARIKIFVE